VDRLLAAVRVDLLDALHPAQPGRARHRAARLGFAFHKTRGAAGAASPSACSGSRRCSRRSSWAPSSAPSRRAGCPSATPPATRHELAQPALAR
jgi:hypothetical protein